MLAGRVQRHLGGDAFVPERWVEHAGAAAQPLAEHGFRPAVEAAFSAYDGLVLVVPLGVAARVVGPLLVDKHTDPAVVVIDEAGQFVIPLVAGHLGGANALAESIALAIGAQPVITTAAESLGRPALDLIAQEQGWAIDGESALTRVSAALVDGDPVAVFQDAGAETWWRSLPREVVRYSTLAGVRSSGVGARIVVTDRVVSPLGDGAVVFRPRSLTVGVGCVRGISAEELDALIGHVLADAGLALASVRELATIDVKRDEKGLSELATRHGWPVRYFSAAELRVPLPPSGPSDLVAASVGVGAVCEPAALLAAGATQLVVAKQKTSRATVAVARIAPVAAVGSLAIVGIGPGGREDITERGRFALEAADVVVGYQGYLDLVRPWLGPKVYHGSPIGDEVERCRLAIALARDGQAVTLVSSGDAGIYGMAGLIFEVLGDEGATAMADRVEVVPGVSAAQAAAALLGAPLMSDFVVISLSDLLIPWEVLERRIEAAALGDFVVALYNPASVRRRTQLTRAREILLRYRAGNTPVGLVRNASRPSQEVVVTDLEHLPEAAVDMLTVVIVGNSATIRVGERITTRRGYHVGGIRNDQVG